ncbi:enoyl-CoA hydratase-related protein [Variovorax terrae]|uniref:Enoyl-CoA hydratase-related protein n=1 Tax=Variovorax terrae TaxID=2923278 RepID=A0A9X1VSX8_9BURK|nr:enoyl-CoA hydratase-related protein [Variovorax terrae]MCJ0762360.1 enoyl-CoA hydratase-related protein [Variovorax terrae]
MQANEQTSTAAMSPSNDVLIQLDAGVLLVTLNRPDRLNALTTDSANAYMQIMLDASVNPEVRVIVVTGAGKGFCAGADMGYLAQLKDGQPRAEKLQRHWFTTQIPKPVIAAINGACVGIGFVIAMMCDMRIAARSARVGAGFARLGLPLENGVAWPLVRSLGYSRAFQHLAVGTLQSGDALLQSGLVNEVVDDAQLLPRAMELAHEIADNCSPRSLATLKRQLLRAAQSSLPEADRLSDGLMKAALAGDDFKEAMAAKKEMRAPAFAPLLDESVWWPSEVEGQIGK